MWGKGEGTLLEKGCLLPSPTPPPLILPRLLTGGEAARREFLLEKGVGEGHTVSVGGFPSLSEKIERGKLSFGSVTVGV